MIAALAWAPVPAGTARRDVAWSLLDRLAPGVRVTNPCPWCGGPHGPVRLHGVPFVGSVAYAGGYALAAVADAGTVSHLGVDAESAVSPSRDAAALAGVLGPGRETGLREWTRVEAALKADGRGLRVDPAAVAIDGDGPGWRASVPGRASPLEGADLAGPDGIVVSAAIVPRPLTREAASGAGRSTR